MGKTNNALPGLHLAHPAGPERLLGPDFGGGITSRGGSAGVQAESQENPGPHGKGTRSTEPGRRDQILALCAASNREASRSKGLVGKLGFVEDSNRAAPGDYGAIPQDEPYPDWQKSAAGIWKIRVGNMEKESALSGANVGIIWCECRHHPVRTIFVSGLYMDDFKDFLILTILTRITARQAPPDGGPACF